MSVSYTHLEKEDECTVEEVESFLQHASDLGLVILYEVEGRRYGWVQQFRQQVRAKRPLFPLPPGYVIRDKQMIADDNHAIGKNKENDSVSELGQKMCIRDRILALRSSMRAFFAYTKS